MVDWFGCYNVMCGFRDLCWSGGWVGRLVLLPMRFGCLLLVLAWCCVFRCVVSLRVMG